MNKLVDKRVRINLSPFQRSPFMTEAFEMAATEQGWSPTEITLAVSQTKGLPLNEKYEVLQQYCMTYGDDVQCTQEDVQYMLHFLNHPTHYLCYKAIESWDEFDWSNYNSLKRKATSRVTRKFGLFCETVEEKDKYLLEKPPSVFYDTLEEALEAVPVGQEAVTNIYSLWVKEA